MAKPDFGALSQVSPNQSGTAHSPFNAAVLPTEKAEAKQNRLSAATELDGEVQKK